MGYLRISVEMMWKCHADMSVVCALPCLLGFLPLFSPPITDRIDEQLGANFPEMDREENHQATKTTAYMARARGINKSAYDLPGRSFITFHVQIKTPAHKL
ncbi:hypothetical protein LOK49_LG05G03830 [Camellia lanceoleosa]|uniref:Uncharacterized protein n=1 Tax=Camellia lanceoleosa TaxID=1840588 RepID=A0ACC0HNJ4_9ERIC|nr:hypothetical protein LOK49_LG05G03830 [Camellia lanceoleosa]